MRTSSVLSTGYKPLPRERPRHICRGGESPCQRRHSPCLPHERGLSQSSIRDSKKYGTFWPVIDLSFLNKFVETHILNGEYLFPQGLGSKREPHDHFGLKGRIPVGSCLQFLWRNKCYAFQGLWSTCLVELTLELRNWCLERNILVTAQHVPGKLNTVADSESRVFNDSREWKIDLFAS